MIVFLTFVHAETEENTRLRRPITSNEEDKEYRRRHPRSYEDPMFPHRRDFHSGRKIDELVHSPMRARHMKTVDTDRLYRHNPVLNDPKVPEKFKRMYRERLNRMRKEE